MINVFNINGDGPIHEADLVRTDEDGMWFEEFLNYIYCIIPYWLSFVTSTDWLRVLSDSLHNESL
jgi:hypothetical protein